MEPVPAVPTTAAAAPQWWWRFLSGALLAPSTIALRRWAGAGLVTSILIVLTGAGVRLSQSGLGCTNWPDCTATSLVASGATGDSLVHRWVEFGNRLVTVAIFIVAIGLFIAAWRYRDSVGRRRDLVWLAAAQPAAIVVQAVLGGFVVLTKLNPALVSLHFLASVALLAAAVALYVRCQESREPGRPLVPRPVQLLALGVVGAVALMMTVGTVVTGTGPLAGAPDVARYSLPLEGVTQFHADIGWLLAGLGVALLLALHLGQAPRRAVRLAWLGAGLVAVQGVVGYAQYFSGLPAGLVWVHVTGSTAIWVVALFLPYTLRDRSALPPGHPAEPLPEADPGTSLPR